MILVRILMSKSGFEDEVLIKLIIGVVKHVTIDELGPVDLQVLVLVASGGTSSSSSNSNASCCCLFLLLFSLINMVVLFRNTSTSILR
jgi:hypothetical protein